MKFKMAATAGLSLTLDPMGKMFQNASSLKPLGQLKPNCPGIVIQTVHECSLDGPLQTLRFLFRYEIQNGGYGRT